MSKSLHRLEEVQVLPRERMRVSRAWTELREPPALLGGFPQVEILLTQNPQLAEPTMD